MAKFCTKCGAPADVEARFCEDCGAPHQTPAAAVPVSTESAAPRQFGRRAILIAGSMFAVFAIVGGAVYLTADEAASPEVFGRAINSYYDQNPAAAAKLLCVADFDLTADPVLLTGFESWRRNAMDSLVVAGLYSQPEVLTSGSFITTQTYSYSRTAAGKEAVKDGRLCVAPAINVRSVRFEQRSAGTKVAALFQYEFRKPAPWLKDELAKRVSHSLRLDDDHLAVLELRNGKWVMTTDDPRAARSVAAGRLEMPKLSLTQRIKSWFRTGNPLVGQWRITNSLWLAGARISFTPEQASVGRPNEAVRYEIRGDTVTVHYLSRNRSDVFTIQDEDHISLSADTDVLLLERIKDQK